LKLLGSKDQYIRYQAAQALGQIAPSSLVAVGPLAKALGDDSELVRRWAAWALAKHKEGARAALPELRKALKDPNDEVVIFAAHALWLVTRDKGLLQTIYKGLE